MALSGEGWWSWIVIENFFMFTALNHGMAGMVSEGGHGLLLEFVLGSRGLFFLTASINVNSIWRP